MLAVLKVLLKWCDVVTALVIYSADLNAHDRTVIKLRLAELKQAIKNFEKESET